MKSRFNGRSAWLWASGLVVAVALGPTAGPAAGQYQLGDGRGLDRNLQEGSGGINAPRRQNPYGRYSDAVVTGNVGGTAAFRDRIGYRAAGEFTDRTSADDTFGFRRRSLPQSVRPTVDTGAQPTATNPLLSPTRVEGTVLRRGGTGPSVGEVARQGRAYPHSFVIEDGRDASSRALAPDGPMVDALRDRLSAGPAAAGLLADDRGQVLQLTTSPLTGLRQEVIGQMHLPRLEQDEQDELHDLDELDEDERRARRALEDRWRGRLDGALAERERRDRRPPRLSDRIRDRRVDPLRDAVSHIQEAEELEPGDDAYADLLRAIDQEVPAGLRLGTRSRPIEEDGEVTRIEQLAEEFERLRRGEDIEDGVEPADEEETLDALASGLSYDLPAVETFVGARDSSVNRLLAQAEQAMSNEDYFKAQSIYERVLAVQPGYAIAEMGRVHAQLGAGLYLSAALNLRRALVDHPQLIAARYRGDVMIDSERLEVIDRELETVSRADPQPAALLRSYLAYQRDQRQDLAVWLDELEHLSDDGDAMPGLLRRIWLDGDSDDGRGAGERD